ncbi:hypothetical protein DC932_RS24695 [Vibrio parahaemolyticus]|nr:hypothetical protein [Vibrio parahaemolyticus]
MNKKLLFFLTAFLTAFAPVSFAAGEVEERMRLVSSLYYVLTIFVMFLGLVMMYQAALKLKRRTEDPNDTKAFPSAILVTFFAGALAFNYSGTAGSMISSLLGSDKGYCFVLNDSMEDSKDLHTDNCWDSTNSEILGDIADKVDEMESGKGDVLKENAKVIVGLFQFIGLIYFAKGIYGLKLTSEGQGRATYGKSIITMILAALIIDLPHTLEFIKETLQLIGFGT